MKRSALNTGHHDVKILFSRLGEGDHEAFSTLLNIYQPVIFGQAVAYLRQISLSADVVQEVFLALWQQRSSISRMENPAGYLMIIARNKIMDEFRNSVDNNALNRLETILVSATPSVQKTMEEREMWQLIEKAVQQLPPQRKKVFELNKKQGLSYQEIAKELQISRETVKVHLVKALAFLRQVLRDRLVNWLVLSTLLEKIFYC